MWTTRQDGWSQTAKKDASKSQTVDLHQDTSQTQYKPSMKLFDIRLLSGNAYAKDQLEIAKPVLHNESPYFWKRSDPISGRYICASWSRHPQCVVNLDVGLYKFHTRRAESSWFVWHWIKCPLLVRINCEPASLESVHVICKHCVDRGASLKTLVSVWQQYITDPAVQSSNWFQWFGDI